MKPHEIDRELMLNKLDILPTKTYSVLFFECSEYEGCWFCGNWLFDDINIAKSFIDKYRVDITGEVEINVGYEIAREYGDYQKLELQVLETTDEIPVLKKKSIFKEKLYSIY